MKRASWFLIFTLLLLLASLPAHGESNSIESGLRSFKAGNYEEAVHRFEQAVKDNPDDASVHALVGFAYAGLGRYKEAAGSYKRAVELRPEYLNAQINLCWIYANLGRFGDALPACEKASDLNSRCAAILNDVGWMQFQLNRYGDAKRTFQRAIAIESLITGDSRNAFEARRKFESLDQNLATKAARIVGSQLVTNVDDHDAR
jgi:tetratricopeptide (TPR) repeat protein